MQTPMAHILLHRCTVHIYNAIIYECSIIEPAFTKSKKCQILKLRKCSPTNIEVHTVPLELLHAKIYITEHTNKESGTRYEVSTKGYSFLLYVYHEFIIS